ncbi:hypothetical protein C5S32_07615 [ANME-1 cluster archaeon GoMg1]|nr:hypothetical protein [ANME-1 cluster archaeon GoMg1]
MQLKFTARQILISGRCNKPEILYENDEFTRLKFTIRSSEGVNRSAEVLVDALPKDGIEFLYLNIPVVEREEVIFSLNGLIRESRNSAFGAIYRSHGELPSVWIPKLPSIRQRDLFNRILSEHKCEVSNEGEMLQVRAPVEGSLEITWLALYQEKYLGQLVAQTPWEQKRFAVLDSGTYIPCIADFFDYLIRGNLYRLSPTLHGRTISGSESYCLFLIAETLSTLTEKDIYQVLQKEIAYSLLLGLEATGRWRHGSWSDKMETHTRFQVDGVNLLLHYYRHTGQQDFLNGASLAAKFLISTADEVSRGRLWFLHDTLEIAPSNYHLRHSLRSKAFGKSIRNTFTLNTHIYTLLTLFELQKEVDSDEISEAINQGWEALREVINARPAEHLYRWLCLLMENKLAFPIGKPTRLNQALCKLTRYAIGWILVYSKLFYPRLVMPNGYIDRHLSLIGFSYNYHFVNLWDLVRIYRYRPEPWLRKVIDQGINYTLRSNLSKYAFQNKFQNLELVGEIFQVYAAITPSFARDTLAAILTRLKQVGCGVTPGLLGFDWRAVPAELQVHSIKVRDRDVELVNISNNLGWGEFLAINLSSVKKEVNCEVQQDLLPMIHKDSFVMTTSDRHTTELSQPYFLLQPWDYVILQFRYDMIKKLKA